MSSVHAAAIVSSALVLASHARLETARTNGEADAPRQALIWEAQFTGDTHYDHLGLRVAASGDTVFALTQQDDLFVYTRRNGVWSRTQVIDDNSSATRVASMAMQGDTAVLGAPDDYWAVGNRGSVYVYERNGSGVWALSQTLTPSDDPVAAFGDGLDLSGDTLLVFGGMRGDSRRDVYVFTRVAGVWSETQKLPIGDGTIVDGGIAVDGSTAVVGVPRQTVAGREFQGVAYVLTKDGAGVWTVAQTLLAPDGDEHENLGADVALDGNRMLITAQGWNDHASSVYVFTRSVDGTWIFEAKLSDPVITDDVNTSFGRNAALSGDKALIAAGFHGLAERRRGVAYLYARADDGTWHEQQRLLVPSGPAPISRLYGGAFGSPVALDGATAVVAESEFEFDYGAIQIYRGYTPSPEHLTVGVGASPASPMFALHANNTGNYGNLGWGFVPWLRYLQAGGGMRPAVGDVDGDGLDEVVIGLERVGFTNGWIAVMDDAAHHHALLRWIRVQWPAYDEANGEVFPAVGDLDGDGRAEIVAGFGPGGRGYYEIFDDAVGNYQHLAWGQVPWTYYVERDGSTHPAIGDVDGDGTKEIVLGLGSGSNGWLQVVNGAGAGYSHRAWVQIPWIAYNAANGTTFPAVGDVDGDLRGEIVVGLGDGSGGWVAAMDDGAAGFAHVAWLRLQWDFYNANYGETHPAVGNLDADPQAEIVLGVGTCVGEGGWFEVVDDALAGFASVGWQHAGGSVFRTAGSATWPAIGRLR